MRRVTQVLLELQRLVVVLALGEMEACRVTLPPGTRDVTAFSVSSTAKATRCDSEEELASSLSYFGVRTYPLCRDGDFLQIGLLFLGFYVSVSPLHCVVLVHVACWRGIPSFMAWKAKLRGYEALTAIEP